MIVDLAIRDAELNDAPALAVLMCEFGYETTHAEMSARLERILPDPRYKTLVAVATDRVCGMIGTVSNASYEHNDFSGRIMALVVSTDSRGRGIGRALVTAAEKDFSKRKITRIAVNTHLTRKEAHKFYESLGYIRNGFRFVKNLRPPQR
jgi:ribosomal protein S18 acetylase RimI-like enzyme